MKKVLLQIINLYQKYYSPTRPARCIFVPSCSQYAMESIEKYITYLTQYVEISYNKA